MYSSKFLNLVCFLALGLMAMAVPQASAHEKSPRDEDEAVHWAQEALTKYGYRNVQVNPQYIMFGDAKGNYGIALARIGSISEEYSGGFVYRVFWQDYARDQRDAIALSPRLVSKFHAALEYLAENARTVTQDNLAKERANFEVQLKAWREAAVKPTMPESAREHQVLAEFAFKEKNVDKAIGEYMAALGIFPTWPEGQYNLATLAGEKKLYETAIQHMQEYLELAPDSPDVPAAKDSIIIWRDKLQTVKNALQADASEPHGKPRRK